MPRTRSPRAGRWTSSSSRATGPRLVEAGPGRRRGQGGRPRGAALRRRRVQPGHHPAPHERAGPPATGPARIVVVNRSPARLGVHARRARKAQRTAWRTGEQVKVEYVHNADPAENDRLMAEMPPGSLVVNGTGMGKDSPGSPITDQGVFPEGARVWELNYRGELDFLHQARRQEARRALFIEDGWRYFVHGWTCVMEEVFDVPMTPEVVGRAVPDRAGAAQHLAPEDCKRTTENHEKGKKGSTWRSGSTATVSTGISVRFTRACRPTRAPAGGWKASSWTSPSSRTSARSPWRRAFSTPWTTACAPRSRPAWTRPAWTGCWAGAIPRGCGAATSPRSWTPSSATCPRPASSARPACASWPPA